MLPLPTRINIDPFYKISDCSWTVCQIHCFKQDQVIEFQGIGVYRKHFLTKGRYEFLYHPCETFHAFITKAQPGYKL